MILLKVQAGSHLYGYATPESDIDFFEVHDTGFIRPNDPDLIIREAEQTIVDGIDVTRMTLDRFIEKARKGSHQALDAMFAPTPLEDRLQGFREAYRVGMEVVPTYERAITQFTFRDGGVFRYQRHAMRILLNLNDIIDHNRYNPTLTEETREYVNTVAHYPTVKFRRELMMKTVLSLHF